MSFMYNTLVCLFVAIYTCGLANGGNVYFYEETPLYVYPGQCINFAARSHFSFFNDTTGNLQVTWKKDTRVLNNTGKWFNITYARASDSAFYQVEVKNKRLCITEETLFWLNVQECRVNEKEMPGSTTKCKTSCVEMCPAGWSYLASSNGNRCYKYFGEPKSWLAARDSCQNIGSQLAVAGNEQENSFIGSLVKSAEGSWIGLNDRISESTFLWNYEKTNSFSFTAWAASEPNNYNAKCNIENCVVTNSITGQWADVICNSFYPFVCQRTSRGDASWQCINDNCEKSIRFFDQLAMWHDAKQICKSFGGKLIEINSKPENDNVTNLIYKDAWIGLNDIAEAGSFVWNQLTYSGKQLPYKNWAQGEPNDMVFQRDYSESCDGEDCVILKDWQSKTQWYDLSCDTRKPYVCEKNRDSLFSTGLLIGIVLGSMIGVAVIAGIVNAAMRRRNRSQVKEFALNAFERERAQTFEGRNSFNPFGNKKK